jgi:hypothetical protein
MTIENRDTGDEKMTLTYHALEEPHGIWECQGYRACYVDRRVAMTQWIKEDGTVAPLALANAMEKAVQEELRAMSRERLRDDLWGLRDELWGEAAKPWWRFW